MSNPTIGANTIATDLVGGAENQYFKLRDGTVGSSTPIAGGADGLQVELKKRTPTTGRTTAGVAINAASVTLLAANPNRRKFAIYNNASQILYVAFASSASIASGGFAMALAANGGSYISEEPVDAAIITGIWAAAGTGYANITEWT